MPYHSGDPFASARDEISADQSQNDKFASVLHVHGASGVIQGEETGASRKCDWVFDTVVGWLATERVL
jgi:hypothetical protein